MAYPFVPFRNPKRQKKLHTWRVRPTLIPFISLASPILLLRGFSSSADAPYPSASQKSRNRLRRLLLPQPPDRGGSRVLPPMSLPYILPQLPDLGNQALHSVKRWWRVCFFPPPHHQHRSSSVLRILSFSTGRLQHS